MPFDPTSYTELLASTREKLVTKELVNQILTLHPATELFVNTAKSYTGESLQENIVAAEHANSGWAADGHGTHSVAQSNDIVKRVAFSWPHAHVAPVRLEFETLQKNSGPEALVNLATAHMQAAKEKIAKDLAGALHSTTGVPNGPLSLDVIIDDTKAIGGLDPATSPFWKSVVRNEKKASTDIRKAFDLVLNDIRSNGGQRPTDVLAGRAIYEAYQDFLAAKGWVALGPTAGKVDSSFQEIYHAGLRVVYDPDAPDAQALFIHRPSLVAGYLTDNLMKVTPSYQVQGTTEFVTPIVSIVATGTTQRRNHAKLTWS